MIRISNILDDMLVLDSVVRVIKKRFHVPGRSPRISSRISARGAPPSGRAFFPSTDATPPTHGKKKRLSESENGVCSPALALDRLRMSPSPRHRSRKTHSRRASFKDLNEDGNNCINTIFETQEVLLHNACSLIRCLVMDNSKVRLNIFFLPIFMLKYWCFVTTVYSHCVGLYVQIRSFLVHDIDNHWYEHHFKAARW